MRACPSRTARTKKHPRILPTRQKNKILEYEIIGQVENLSYTYNPTAKARIMKHSTFRSLDHLAIVVDDTEVALQTWRDRVGLEVLFSEDVNDGTIRLTHLDLGNTHLQLVEPLTADHPLQAWLAENGAGLHHFCLAVDDVEQAFDELPKQGLPTAKAVHQGTRGKKALFLDPSGTGGVPLEVTGN